MPTQPRLEPKHFFELLPSIDHRTGDIWRSLPSFGLLGTRTVDGIVITPACDLANRKSETVTYLPIVPIAEYLASSAYRHECWIEVLTALGKLKCAGLVTPPNRYENPLLDEVNSACSGLTIEQRATTAGTQLIAYAKYLSECAVGKLPTIQTVEQVLSTKRLQDALSRLVTNALKPDIHFLPADGAPKEYSAVRAHSVVLFRYPLTVPIEILDAAQRVSPDGWEELRISLKVQYPVIDHFLSWPVKLTALKDDFLSDLLSRYVSTYIRLGSRDFTSETVADISENVRGK